MRPSTVHSRALRRGRRLITRVGLAFALALGAGAAATVPATAAPTDAAAPVLIDTGIEGNADRVVLDVELPDLSSLVATATVDDQPLAFSATPFGASATIPARAGERTLQLSDTAVGARLTLSYVDPAGNVLGFSSVEVEAAVPGTPPLEPQPQPQPEITPVETPAPVPASLPTTDSAAEPDALAVTGGLVAGGLAVLAAAAAIAVGIIFARKGARA